MREGGYMNLKRIVKTLSAQAEYHKQALNKLDLAIAALSSETTRKRRNPRGRRRGSRRRMSTKTRRAISKAQKARWAKTKPTTPAS